MVMVKYYLESDDDTYIYGDRMFKCKFCRETNKYIQPYIRKENDKTIKFFRDKRFFAIYENGLLIEIIETMTCWSDDYISYKIRDNIAYERDENYHGRPLKRNEQCNIDLSNFIRSNDL
jgi:hypothetical protein